MVKKGLLYCILFSLYWSIFVTAQTNQAIINYWAGGRFGDRIVSYVIAKWVSLKFNIPFLLNPFQYSSMLRFGREEKKYSDKWMVFKFDIPLLFDPKHAIIPKRFEGIIRTENEQGIFEHEQENVIFEINGVQFHIDGCPGIEETIKYIFQDQYFVAEIKKMLHPAVPLPEITLPQDKITVAVHVRKGGGYDPPLSSIQYYTKNMQDSRLDVIDSDIDILESCYYLHSQLDVINSEIDLLESCYDSQDSRPDVIDSKIDALENCCDEHSRLDVIH